MLFFLKIMEIELKKRYLCGMIVMVKILFNLCAFYFVITDGHLEHGDGIKRFLHEGKCYDLRFAKG